MSGKGDNGAVSWNRYGYQFGKQRYTRVTTILNKKSKGDALIKWAADQVAGKVRQLAEQYRNGEIDRTTLLTTLLDDDLANTYDRVREEAAEFGTIFHQLVEDVSNGVSSPVDSAKRSITSVAASEEAEKRMLERLMPDVAAFQNWCEEFKPIWHRAEFQVFNDTHGYAGSIDFYAEVLGKRIFGDCKTSKRIYDSYALQLAAYRYAEFIGEPDGNRSPVPDVDATCILHVRDGECKLIELDTSVEVFNEFVACKTLYDGDRNRVEPVEWLVEDPYD